MAVGGFAYLVVQRNLGSDSLQAWLTEALDRRAGEEYDVQRLGSAKGYRVLQVRREGASEARHFRLGVRTDSGTAQPRVANARGFVPSRSPIADC